MRGSRVLLVIAALVVPNQSSAQAARPWIRLDGGFARYAMSDLNKFGVGYFNQSFPSLDMPEANNGYTYGGSLGLDVGRGVALGVSFARRSAKTKATWNGTIVNDQNYGTYQAQVDVDYDLGAQTISGFAEYTFVRSARSDAYFGLSLGRIISSAKQGYTQTGYLPLSYKYDGSGLCFEGYVGAEHWVAPQLALVGRAGYRAAKVSEVEVDGTKMFWLANGEEMAIDWSGFDVQAGLKAELQALGVQHVVGGGGDRRWRRVCLLPTICRRPSNATQGHVKG